MVRDKQTVGEVMTPDPLVVQAAAPVLEAARAMRHADVGPLIVVDDKDQVCGMLTDRDIVVRAVAEGRDPVITRVGEICSRDLTMVSPRASVDEAIGVMRKRAIRRLPVLDGSKAVGMVSLGDLVLEHEPKSALARISAAPPNR